MFLKIAACYTKFYKSQGAKKWGLSYVFYLETIMIFLFCTASVIT